MLWLIFICIVVLALVIDLSVYHRKSHAVKGKEAYLWSFFWIGLALVFNVFVYLSKGHVAALQFFTGYVIEKCLSIDNIFIFAVIFSYFNIPEKYQHRVLFYGVLGAVLIRLAFIFVGVYFVARFSWLLYFFGLFLFFLAFQLLRKKKIYNPERSIIARCLKKIIPITGLEKERFFVVKRRRLYMTPLFLSLVLVEGADFVAAMDSIPAIFVITTDPFIIYTSNIFALLGLRALYFVVVDLLGKLKYLNVGLALVLLFLGCKMLLSGLYPLSMHVSFMIIVLILGGSIYYSLRSRKSPSH